MELRTGDDSEFEWTDNITRAIARTKLTQAFYSFVSIDWVPPEKAVAIAHEQNKPILAVVLWGGLDEQSC
jgi:hypothetical protein